MYTKRLNRNLHMTNLCPSGKEEFYSVPNLPENFLAIIICEKFVKIYLILSYTELKRKTLIIASRALAARTYATSNTFSGRLPALPPA